jgi:hypothetical protein
MMQSGALRGRNSAGMLDAETVLGIGIFRSGPKHMYRKSLERKALSAAVPANGANMPDAQTMEDKFHPLNETAHCVYAATFVNIV